MMQRSCFLLLLLVFPVLAQMGPAPYTYEITAVAASGSGYNITIEIRDAGGAMRGNPTFYMDNQLGPNILRIRINDLVMRQMETDAGGRANLLSDLDATYPAISWVKGNADSSGGGGIPAGAVVMIVSGSCPVTLGTGWAEEATLAGKFVLATTDASGNIGTTGGVDSVTPAGSVSAPTFTGSALGTHAHGIGSYADAAVSAGTPVGSNAWPAGVPTFSGTPFSGVINHTHTVSVNDPGHTHLTQRYPTATGSSSGFTNDTSMSGTLTNNTLPTASGTTGITASTQNPGGGVSSITPAGTVAWPAGVPAFNGSALGTHQHGLGGSSEAVSAGTPAGSVSVPVFSGNSQENRPAFARVIFCRKT